MYNSFTTHAVIQGLKPFTFFRFAICSHADSVIGPFGDEIRCRTAEGRKYLHEELSAFINSSYTVTQTCLKFFLEIQLYCFAI